MISLANLTAQNLRKIGVRWIAMSLVASWGLAYFYNRYDILRDPQFTASIVAFGGVFDVLVKWLWPDKVIEELKAEVERLKMKCGEQ
jgi:hypothetical protein